MPSKSAFHESEPVYQVVGLNYLVTQNAIVRTNGGSCCNCLSYLGIFVQEYCVCNVRIVLCRHLGKLKVSSLSNSGWLIPKWTFLMVLPLVMLQTGIFLSSLCFTFSVQKKLQIGLCNSKETFEHVIADMLWVLILDSSLFFSQHSKAYTFNLKDNRSTRVLVFSL